MKKIKREKNIINNVIENKKKLKKKTYRMKK